MSADPIVLYSSAKLSLLEGGIDFATNKFQVVLLTASYTPSLAHAAYSDVSGNEVSGAAGTGYTTGGQALGSPSVAASGAGAIVTASPSVWQDATFAAQYAAIIQMAGSSIAPTDKLIGYVNLNDGGGAVAVAGATFTITWPSAGILALS
jgi:hypothetical protein